MKRCIFLVVYIFMFCASWSVTRAEDAYISDPTSGIALYGYDPVAYFTKHRAVVGRKGIEREYGGVVWRFESEANRDRFYEAPQIYLPRFGGYGVMMLGEGYLSEGNPLIWVLKAGRLYLFFNEEKRDRWLADSERYTAMAETAWTKFLPELYK